jgi:mitochondrial inner membrane protein COX18
MAILLASRAQRPLLLSLPPLLRVQAFRRTQETTRKASTIAGYIASVPISAIDAIHSFGIPYYAALPLTAVLVRGVVTHFLFARRARKQAQLINQLYPLTAASVNAKMVSPGEVERTRKLIRESYNSRWKRIQNDYRLRMRPFVLYYRYMGQNVRTFGSRRIPWGLANFGLLITFTEAIRMKCGSHEGLLSLVASPIQGLWRLINAALSSVAPSVNSHGKTAGPALSAFDSEKDTLEKLEAWKKAQQSQPTVQAAQASKPEEFEINSLLPDQNLEIDTSSTYFDSALQTEGLSWCTDLTIPDPTFVLPITFFAVLMANIVLRPRMMSNLGVFAPTPGDQAKRGLTRLQRISITFAAVFAYVSIHFPAAMLLYLIPNMAVGSLHGMWTAYRHPVRPAIRPCSMRIRRTPQSGFED